MRAAFYKGHETISLGQYVPAAPAAGDAQIRVSRRGDCPACRAGHSHTRHRLPDSLSLRAAAPIEPLAAACHDVRTGEVKAGEYAGVQGGGPIGARVCQPGDGEVMKIPVRCSEAVEQ